MRIIKRFNDQMFLIKKNEIKWACILENSYQIKMPQQKNKTQQNNKQFYENGVNTNLSYIFSEMQLNSLKVKKKQLKGSQRNKNKKYKKMNFYQQKYFKPYHEIVYSPEKFRQQKFKTPSTHKYRPPQRAHYSDKYNIEPVWQYLYNEGKKTQQELMEKHQLSKHKIDVQCTFKPMIRHNKRYLVPSHSTFLERNNLWLQNKIEKIVKEKQEDINKDLKQCTFAPQINPKSKKTRPDKYENTIHKKTCPNQKLHKSAIRVHPKTVEENVEYPSTPGRKTYVDIERAKQMIKNELKRLVL